MAKRRDRKIVTRKHLARVERERMQTRYLTFGTLAVVLIVIVLVGYGFLEQSVVQPSQPVVSANGEEISTRDFQVQVRYRRSQLVQQYISTLQTMQLFGGDENTQALFQNNLQQIQLSLNDPISLGSDILTSMVADLLIRQEAARRGITVTQAEVDRAIEEEFGFFADGTPTPAAESTSRPTSTLSPTQLALMPATSTPTQTPELTPEAPLTPSASPTATIEPTPSATPTAYTRNSFESIYNEYLQALNQEIDFTQDDLFRLFENQLYREKLRDAITADISQEREEVWARHILVDSEEAAKEVIDRLNNGEDWAELAAEVSTDPGTKDRGGDLGWFPTGQMDPAFEAAAFALMIGQISDPIQTQFGWHVIQALGHELRPMTEAQLQRTREEQFNEWLVQEQQNANIELRDYWSNRVPVEPALPDQVAGALPLQPTP